ncbi:MAG: hypothetical protein A3J38_10040 [Gammaproteobacteria bacterium RIFCSPHIGHO2_12_FULL_45_9]|nr:MAG: hypothetical protein A3J38_10040 [Gammaproteobacteria bacterium RIFCSPHIGHO2_12_FULL_45_9]
MFQRRLAAHFTPHDPAPPHIKALILPEGSWTGFYGEPAEVRYTFSLPTDLIEQANLLAQQPGYVDHSVPLSGLEKESAVVSYAFAQWAAAANITFTNNDTNYQLPIFRFEQAPSFDVLFVVAGYGEFAKGQSNSKFSAGMGFNANFFKDSFKETVFHGVASRLISARKLEMMYVALHEAGHAGVGLKHPFDERQPFAFTELSKRLTSYSVMNYNHERDLDDFTLIPITPMPADIEAARFMYGANPRTGAGDDLYHVRDYIRAIASGEKKATIASLPWDSGGIDTLSAHGEEVNVALDLRSYSRSKVWDGIHNVTYGYITMPDILIENVIGGTRRVDITLNSCNNIVDVREASVVTITVDPLHCGNDTVMGFNPSRDRFILQVPQLAAPGTVIGQIQSSAAGEVELLGEKIAYGPGVRIVFDENNSVVLADVGSADVASSIVMQQDPPLAQATMRHQPDGQPAPAQANSLHEQQIPADLQQDLWHVFSGLPKELFHDFKNAFYSGVVFTFLSELSENILKKYHCSDKQISVVKQAVQALLTIYTGSIIASGASCMTSYLFKYLGFSERNAMLAGAAAFTAVTAAELLTGAGLITGGSKRVASMVGGYAGSRFALWAKSKIPDFLHRRQQVELVENHVLSGASVR